MAWWCFDAEPIASLPDPFWTLSPFWRRTRVSGCLARRRRLCPLCKCAIYVSGIKIVLPLLSNKGSNVLSWCACRDCNFPKTPRYGSVIHFVRLGSSHFLHPHPFQLRGHCSGFFFLLAVFLSTHLKLPSIWEFTGAEGGGVGAEELPGYWCCNPVTVVGLSGRKSDSR